MNQEWMAQIVGELVGAKIDLNNPPAGGWSLSSGGAWGSPAAEAAAKAMKVGDYVKSSPTYISVGGRLRYGQIKKIADYSAGFGDVVWSDGEWDHLNFVNLVPATQQEFEKAGGHEGRAWLTKPLIRLNKNTSVKTWHVMGVAGLGVLGVLVKMLFFRSKK